MIVMSVALSEQCNLNCTYCNVDKLSKKKISSNLFIEEYWKKRSELQNELIQIDFYGGEPLLQWKLVTEIIEATKDEANVRYFMPTNGLLLNEDRVEYLNAHDVMVSLSFDGLWQDVNRKQLGGKDSLSAFLDKKRLFKKIKKKECHSMIYKDNFNLLENHIFISEELGLNPKLTIVRDVGVWDQEGSEKFNSSFSQLVKWYIENVNLAEMPNLIKEYLGHIILYTSKQVTIDYCGAGETHYSFTEDKLIPCNRFKSQTVIDQIPQFRKMKECEKCVVNKFCKKGCLYENISNNGPIEEICNMYRHIYKELIEMINILKVNETFKNEMRYMIYES